MSIIYKIKWTFKFPISLSLITVPTKKHCGLHLLILRIIVDILSFHQGSFDLY